MPKEESDGSALGALLAPSAGLFAGQGINEVGLVREHTGSVYSRKGLQLQQSLRDDETTSGLGFQHNWVTVMLMTSLC